MPKKSLQHPQNIQKDWLVKSSDSGYILSTAGANVFGQNLPINNQIGSRKQKISKLKDLIFKTKIKNEHKKRIYP